MNLGKRSCTNILWLIGPTGPVEPEQLTSVDVVPQVVGCLEEARKVGVGTIVDVSTEGFALSPLLVKLAAEKTAVHIVAATGCYKPLAMPLPSWAYPPAEPEDIAEHIIAVVNEGVQGTGISWIIESPPTRDDQCTPWSPRFSEGQQWPSEQPGWPSRHTHLPPSVRKHMSRYWARRELTSSES